MSEIPKHEPSKRTKGRKKVTETAVADHGPFVDMSCVADAIEGFGRIFSTWVSRELAGANGQPVYTSEGGYPVKVALTSLAGDEEALHSVEIEFGGPVAHSIADSLKRIADAIQVKP
jgi:hypothetical protein